MSRPIRVICYAWGDKYIDDFLGLTLPALLAPGNLVNLAGRFALEFVFLTQEHQFERVRAAASWSRLSSLCRTELRALDDLIVGHWYGISLSKTLVRGFADLGERMLETDILFFNADFIVADGSLRTVGDRLEEGHRLIFAPSYCVIREAVLPRLEEHLRGNVLAIPPREMAEIGIPHRHYTIRAKTANQRLFRIHRYDHFYWYVDRRTILARQMPIALVAMRPERVVDDIHTFWDYGVVSEIAPTAPHCVLGDSDDYLMIELRDEATFEELMRLGWPSIREIADDLSSFTTRDQRIHLAHELVWHAADLPPAVVPARREFAAFVGAVASRLSREAVSHLNHQFWSAAIGRFDEMRAQFLRSRETGMAPEPEAVAPVRAKAPRRRAARPAAPAARRVRRPGRAVRDAMIQPPVRVIRWARRFCGQVPFVSRSHPYWVDLFHATRAALQNGPLSDRSLLVVTSRPALFQQLGRQTRRYYGLSPGYLLGEKPPEWTLEGKLLVTVTEPDGTIRTTEAKRLSVIRENKPSLQPEQRFDLCICELTWDELVRFREIFDRLRNRLEHGARIIVLCLAPDILGMSARVPRSAFPVEGRSEVLYAGNAVSRLALRLMAASERKRGPSIEGRLAFTLGASLAALMSLVAALAAARQDPLKRGRNSTSLTMIIDLP